MTGIIIGKSKHNLHKREMKRGRWIKEEHLRFLEGVKIHGRDWKNVEQGVGTRTSI